MNHVLLTLAILLQIPLASAHTYLLLSVSVTDDLDRPTWLYIEERTRKSGALFEREWLAIDDSLVLAEVEPTKYFLNRIEFSRSKRGDHRTLEFPFANGIEIERHTIHYAGNFHFDGEKVQSSLAAETIQAACRRFPEIMSQHELVVPVEGQDPIVFEDPCKT
jgi:hypothetical protein